MKAKLKKTPLPMCPKCKTETLPMGLDSVPDPRIRYECRTCDYETFKVVMKRGNYEK